MPQNCEVVQRLIAEHRARNAGQREAHAEESGRGIVVCARKRPLFEQERAGAAQQGESLEGVDSVTCCNPKVTVHEAKLRLDTTQTVEHSEFVLDHTFGEESDTTDIYNAVVRPLTRSVVAGGIGTCFAYGQTGSGKTYTITGIEEHVSEDVFDMLEQQGLRALRSVHVSFFEIAGDRCFDLLHDRTEIFIREDERGDIHVQHLRSEQVGSAGELLEWIRVGSEQRCTRATFKNEASSRTHAVCQITLQQLQQQEGGPYYGEAPGTPPRMCGKLSLIDLAGSERAGDTVHHDQERTKETIAINKSLMVLKECIRSRVLEMRNSTVHVPFRGSRLTLFLKDCFTRADVGTVIIVTLSPLAADANHSLNTCWFANRIKEKGAPSAGVDPLDPHYWSKKEVSAWAHSILGPPAKPHEWVFTPMSGKRLCTMTEPEFARNCAVPCGGRRLYLALAQLLAEARERARSDRDKENRAAAAAAAASSSSSASASAAAADAVNMSIDCTRSAMLDDSTSSMAPPPRLPRPATAAAAAAERRSGIPRRKSIMPVPATPAVYGGSCAAPMTALPQRAVAATSDTSRSRSRIAPSLRSTSSMAPPPRLPRPATAAAAAAERRSGIPRRKSIMPVPATPAVYGGSCAAPMTALPQRAVAATSDTSRSRSRIAPSLRSYVQQHALPAAQRAAAPAAVFARPRTPQGIARPRTPPAVPRSRQSVAQDLSASESMAAARVPQQQAAMMMPPPQMVPPQHAHAQPRLLGSQLAPPPQPQQQQQQQQQQFAAPQQYAAPGSLAASAPPTTVSRLRQPQQFAMPPAIPQAPAPAPPPAQEELFEAQLPIIPAMEQLQLQAQEDSRGYAIDEMRAEEISSSPPLPLQQPQEQLEGRQCVSGKKKTTRSAHMRKHRRRVAEDEGAGAAAGVELSNDFETIYADMKASTSDAVLDSLNGHHASLRWESETMTEASVEELQARAVSGAHCAHVMQVTANKMFTELIARVFELHSKHVTSGGDEEGWAALYPTLHTGYSWPTMCEMFELSRIVSMFRRLYYVMMPLSCLAPHVERLRERLLDQSEALYWSSFGSQSRPSIQYFINTTRYSDRN
eukprot:m51a1_g9879 putative kinesin motor domain containing protein (1090) ;mRNA; r:4888-10292